MEPSSKRAGPSFLYGKPIEKNTRLMFHHQTTKNPAVARRAGVQGDAGVLGGKVAVLKVANVVEDFRALHQNPRLS